MKDKLIPIKQGTTQGCLIASLAMLSKFDKLPLKLEKDILVNGLDRKYGFFVIGNIEEFLKNNGGEIEIYVDNKYFTGVLKKNAKNKNIKIIHNKITIDLIDSLLVSSPIIGYLDYNILGDYSHAPHFVVIESKGEKGYKIIDPWNAKVHYFKKDKLSKGIKLLKEHIKICPLIIRSK